MKTGDEKIRQYLLGNLTEEEAREMDLRIISEPELEETLILAEDDLMDDYLDGILPPPDAELFRRNFLASDERRDEFQNLARLKRIGRESGAQIEIKDQESQNGRSAGRLDNLKNIFRMNLRPAGALFALAVLLIALGIGWRVIFYNPAQTDSARAEQEFAELNRQDLSDFSRLENTHNVTLAAGSFRAAEAENQISAERLENRVLFRLLLPFKVSATALFKVRLAGGRADSLTIEKVHSYENQDGRELRILLPAALLKKGEYRIEISEENNAPSPVVYSFTIQ